MPTKRKVWQIFGGVAAIVVVGFFVVNWLLQGDRTTPHGRIRRETISNAKQIATALMQYASDYDGRLPHSFYNESSLYFVLGSERDDYPTTLNPNGGSFMPNANLAGVLLSDIEYPQDTVLIYESMLWPNGLWPNGRPRVFAFADGSARTGGETRRLVWGVSP